MFSRYSEASTQHFVPRPQKSKVWIKGCNSQFAPPLYPLVEKIHYLCWKILLKWWFFLLTVTVRWLSVARKIFLTVSIAMSAVSVLPSFEAAHASAGRKVKNTANPDIMSVAIQNGRAWIADVNKRKRGDLWRQRKTRLNLEQYLK